MSGVVQVFGRRHDEAIHALRRRRPKSAKARVAGSMAPQCSECYGDRMLVANLDGGRGASMSMCMRASGEPGSAWTSRRAYGIHQRAAW